MKKRTLINEKRINFVLIYNFLIKGSFSVVFGINEFANINFIRKKEGK